MNGQGVCAGFHESRDVMIGMLDHQMDVDGKTRSAAYNPDNLRPEGNVIDKMSIHDVAMNPIRACRFDTMDFITESRKIGGENGWSDDDFVHGTKLQEFQRLQE